MSIDHPLLQFFVPIIVGLGLVAVTLTLLAYIGMVAVTIYREVAKHVKNWRADRRAKEFWKEHLALMKRKDAA